MQRAHRGVVLSVRGGHMESALSPHRRHLRDHSALPNPQSE